MRSAILALAFVSAVTGTGCGIQEHLHEVTGQQPSPADSGGSSGSAGNGGGGGSMSSGSTGGSTGGQGTGGSAGGQVAGGRAGEGQPSDAGGAGGSMSPSSGVTITIGGMAVPREKAIVILHFGHSNMEGKGENPASLRPYFYTTVPRLWDYRGNNNFAQATEPLARRRGTQAGPGMALLKTALENAPADYHFISIGHGVGSATTVDWSKGGLHYGTVIDQARQLKGKVTFGMAAIMLGITDRHLPANQQNGYGDRVSKLVADVRADLETPDLPVMHTDYEIESTGNLAPNGAIAMRFRPQILALPGKIQRLEIVPCDGTGMEDDHHFDLAGHKLWGERAVKIVIDKGWAPWPKP